MLIDTPLLESLLNNPYLSNTFQIFFIIFAILYFIFSLIVIGQIRLMTETVTTEAGPLLRFFSIIHAGIALALIIAMIALF
jgi:hypothetical protein